MSRHPKPLTLDLRLIESFLQSISRLQPGVTLRTRPQIVALIADTKKCLAESEKNEMTRAVRKKLILLKKELKRTRSEELRYAS